MIDAKHAQLNPPPRTWNRREVMVASTAAVAVAGIDSAVAQELPASSRELWQWFRSQPMMNAQIGYLDAASGGPTLRTAMVSEYRAREQQSHNLAATAQADRWVEESSRLATRIAAFVGCDSDEVLFTRGAGEALSTIVSGLDLNAGDEVLMTTQEHPAALSPWLYLERRRGVVIKQLPVPQPLSDPEQVVALFSSAMTERTRVLAIPHILYGDGAVLPIQTLCRLARERNVLTLIDGAQAMGMLDFNIRDLGCDFYATCFHKWLCGSQGTGMLYLRREMLERVWPVEPRHIETSPPLSVPLAAPGHLTTPSALRRMGNVTPYLGPALKGVEAAMDLHQRVGRMRIEARIRELAIYLRMRLQQNDSLQILTPGRPGLWAGIMTVRVPQRAATEIAARLAEQRLVVRAIELPNHSEGAVRISLHAFNSHDEIERLVRGLH